MTLSRLMWAYPPGYGPIGPTKVNAAKYHRTVRLSRRKVRAVRYHAWQKRKVLKKRVVTIEGTRRDNPPKAASELRL